MANCQGCLHFEVCYECTTKNCNVTGDCSDFKNEDDFVKVKHGYWKDRYDNKYDNHLYECSVCGGKALYEFKMDELGNAREVQALTPGCPHCFAKMDARSETGNE